MQSTEAPTEAAAETSNLRHPPSCGSQNHFFGLERRVILTAAPFSPHFIVHRTRFGDNAQSRTAFVAIKKQQPFSYCFFCGRGDRTRTCGILLPKQARYQTAPRLDIIYSVMLFYLRASLLCFAPKQAYSCGSQSLFAPWILCIILQLR